MLAPSPVPERLLPLLQLPSTPASRLPSSLTSSERRWPFPFLEPWAALPSLEPHLALGSCPPSSAPAGTRLGGGPTWPCPCPSHRCGDPCSAWGDISQPDCIPSSHSPASLHKGQEHTVLFRPPTSSPDTSFFSPLRTDVTSKLWLGHLLLSPWDVLPPPHALSGWGHGPRILHNPWTLSDKHTGAQLGILTRAGKESRCHVPSRLTAHLPNLMGLRLRLAFS